MQVILARGAVSAQWRQANRGQDGRQGRTRFDQRPIRKRDEGTGGPGPVPSQQATLRLLANVSRNGQIVEFTASKPRRYYLVLIADVGSVPSSTCVRSRHKS